METLLVLVLSGGNISFKPLKIILDEYPDLYQVALSMFSDPELETKSDFYFLGKILPPMNNSTITNAYLCVTESENVAEDKDFSRTMPVEGLWKSDDAYDALIATKILNHVYRQEFPTVNEAPIQ